jgi:hypothetical protein
MLSKHLLLFLVGCIGTRILLVFLAKLYPEYIMYLTLGIGIGFFYFYFSGSRPFGPETFGDKIWWNDLRPIHGCLYILFSILAFQGNKDAWKVLGLDVIIGLSSFLVFHHFIKKDL